jgi:hypothetical protein
MALDLRTSISGRVLAANPDQLVQRAAATPPEARD